MTRIWPVPDEGLGDSWYVAEVAEGLALVADPGRDPRPYLEAAARHGLRIGFTADTHVHADYPALTAAVADHAQPSWRAGPRGLPVPARPRLRHRRGHRPARPPRHGPPPRPPRPPFPLLLPSPPRVTRKPGAAGPPPRA